MHFPNMLSEPHYSFSICMQSEIILRAHMLSLVTEFKDTLSQLVCNISINTHVMGIQVAYGGKYVI